MAQRAGNSDSTLDWLRGKALIPLSDSPKLFQFSLNSNNSPTNFQDLFSGEDTMLPPDVEQMALFSDSFSDSNHAGREPVHWFSRIWRYQGL
jgi:hypothetical protein